MDLSTACQTGDISLLHELLALDGDQYIDVHAGGEAGFRWACACGHLNVVRELLTLGDARRIDVHARNENGFQEACLLGHLDIVRELLALEGDRRIDVHAGEEAGFRNACTCGHLTVLCELLALRGDRCIDVHARDESGFQEACMLGHLDVVRELLALTGDRRINVHARNECGFRTACGCGRLDVVRKLLALDGDRHVNVESVAEVLQHLLARQLQSDSGQRTPGLLELLRDCAIPQPVLEAAMKQACAGTEYVWPSADGKTQGYRQAAQAISHHVLLHTLKRTRVPHRSGLFTSQVSPALNALALCAVLPGAECPHLVGELSVCGVVLRRDTRRRVGETFLAHYRMLCWVGVRVPVDEGVDEAPGVAALMCRHGRRGAVLRRVQARAAAK